MSEPDLFSGMSIPELVLKRPVTARCVRFAGEIARAQERPELLPFLLDAKSRDGLSAQDAAAHLLGAAEGRISVAETLLRRLVDLGLLRKDSNRHVLTDSGRRAIDSEQVLIPERGNWSLWYVDDPLIPGGILDLAPYKDEPHLGEETRKPKQGQPARPERRFVSPSPVLAQHRNQLSQIPRTLETVRLDALPDKIEDVAAAKLELEWRLDDDKVLLRGDLDGKKLSLDLPGPGVPVIDLWVPLLRMARLEEDWIPEINVLRRAFPATENHEVLRNMRMDLTLQEPGRGIEIKGLGCFDPIVLTGVPICARTRNDAQLWANWRLRDRIDGYASIDRFERWQKEALAPFTEFGDLSTDQRSTVAQQRVQDTAGKPRGPDYWHVVAANDWGI